MTGFIRSEVTRVGFSRAVVGLSGGIDSALSCALAVEALGKENVLAVRMPYKGSSTDSLAHAELLIEQLGIPSKTIEITNMVEPLFTLDPDITKLRKGNIMARERTLVRFPPANLQLRRAQLILMLVALVPTICMTAVGIVLLVISEGSTHTVVAGVLVLTFFTSGITGYILGSIFVGRGASLVRVQNDFVSAVSHELRTPVTSIRLLIDSLRDGRLGETERSQVLELLARETDRLEQLVVRVLELSKLESGAHVFARDRVDVGDLVDEAIAAFDAVTLTNPTPITKRVTPGLTIIGDRSTLVRALLNLLTNAWKYTGDDKRISIESRLAGRWVEVYVRDNGPGIASRTA